MTVPQSRGRCAIYTRKSSEEGLEQSFNSLHAQREACEAYILSQRHEGWQVVTETYDDGGYSGGNMERPGLKKHPRVSFCWRVGKAMHDSVFCPQWDFGREMRIVLIGPDPWLGPET